MRFIRNKYFIMSMAATILITVGLLTSLIEVKADSSGYFPTITIGNSFRTHSLVGGTASFDTTGLAVTIKIPGAKSTDGYVALFGSATNVDTTTITLIYHAYDDSVTFIRKAGTTATKHTFTWLRIRPL